VGLLDALLYDMTLVVKGLNQTAVTAVITAVMTAITVQAHAMGMPALPSVLPIALHVWTSVLRMTRLALQVVAECTQCSTCT
jgi:hypothetical protein